MEIDDDYPEEKSKSQLKREAHALQALGEALVALPLKQLEQIPMEDSLREAVMDCRAITQRGARKRQLQYIGKLMRGIDAQPIQSALEALRARGQRETHRLHLLEQWRDRLLEEGDAALGEALEAFPAAERQPLRQLVRNARREREQGRAPAMARKLFQYL
ncbi:MAG: DUF615 domain-containing protein, partial [Gammaproteobacteria bacterium]